MAQRAAGEDALGIALFAQRNSQNTDVVVVGLRNKQLRSILRHSAQLGGAVVCWNDELGVTRHVVSMKVHRAFFPSCKQNEKRNKRKKSSDRAL
jgi:hypothetical protein